MVGTKSARLVLFGIMVMLPLLGLRWNVVGNLTSWSVYIQHNPQLEYLVADAKAKGCKTLVSVGGIQSNHTRAVTAVATASGMKGISLTWTRSIVLKLMRRSLDFSETQYSCDRPRKSKHPILSINQRFKPETLITYSIAVGPDWSSALRWDG